MLKVCDLRVAVGEREILHGVNLEVSAGETVVLIGRNGAGKSTLAKALMTGEWKSEAEYADEVGRGTDEEGRVVVAGKMLFDGKDTTNGATKNTVNDAVNDATNWRTEQRAKSGLFLAMQQPVEIAGLNMTELLRASLEARDGRDWQMNEVREEIAKRAKQLGMSVFEAERELNVGTSGGEKKKNEILQMMVLAPKIAILDEPDSGVDFDSIETISQALRDFQIEKGVGYLVISHNLKILQKLQVSKVYLMEAGRIVEEGDEGMLRRLAEGGFEGLK